MQASSAMLRLCGTAIVNLDPTHEIGCRALIEANARDGDTAVAPKVYRKLWGLLEEEFDTEPSDATQQLIVALKTGELDRERSAAERSASGGNLEAAQAAPQPGLPALIDTWRMANRHRQLPPARDDARA